MNPLLLVLFGLVALIAGAWALVEGASRMARQMGISALVVGLTVVAIGTSAPELAVSLIASLQDRGALVLGNVVGSNIANIGLILGLGGLAGRITIPDELLRRDFIWLLAASGMTAGFALDGSISAVEGGALLVGAVAFLAFNYQLARGDMSAARLGLEVSAATASDSETAAAASPWFVDLGLIAIGILGLWSGGDWLVTGASDVARRLGMSEYFIALTLVAVGTSLPELATTLVGVQRGESGLVLGNVVGSNILNLFLILGTAVVIRPIAVADATRTLEVPLMIGLTLLLVPILRDGLHVRRRWSLVLLAGYVAAIALALRLDVGR